MAEEVMDICLQVLMESNKSRVNSYSVRNSVLNISHITFWDCRVHILFNNLSRNSCMWQYLPLFSLGNTLCIDYLMRHFCKQSAVNLTVLTYKSAATLQCAINCSVNYIIFSHRFHLKCSN